MILPIGPGARRYLRSGWGGSRESGASMIVASVVEGGRYLMRCYTRIVYISGGVGQVLGGVFLTLSGRGRVGCRERGSRKIAVYAT